MVMAISVSKNISYVPHLLLKGKKKAQTPLSLKSDDLEDVLPSPDGADELEPSTKMLKMLNILQQWYQEAPQDKIIIYSQCESLTQLIFLFC